MMTSLPRGASQVSTPSTTNNYYYSNGSFMAPAQGGNGYQVVSPPMGATVPSVPPGAYQTTVNGTTYYVSGSTYYEPVFSDGQVVFKVAQP
jgi:hypothetical protein